MYSVAHVENFYQLKLSFLIYHKIGTPCFWIWWQNITIDLFPNMFKISISGNAHYSFQYPYFCHVIKINKICTLACMLQWLRAWSMVFINIVLANCIMWLLSVRNVRWNTTIKLDIFMKLTQVFSNNLNIWNLLLFLGGRGGGRFSGMYVFGKESTSIVNYLCSVLCVQQPNGCHFRIPKTY